MHDIFDLLLNAGQISETTAALVRRYCERWNLSGFHGLLRTHIFTEEALADLLAHLLKMDRVYNIVADDSGRDGRKQLSWQRCLAWECFPSHRVDDGTYLEIVMVDPTQRERVAYFRECFHHQFSLVVASRNDVISAIHEYFDLADQLPFLKETGCD
ncbi:MAG: hypothetical protein H6618_05410 [Deltaproteobacteria bacterium]|nr:hypothetical protein [Deltaproteobacteria bacterium]